MDEFSETQDSPHIDDPGSPKPPVRRKIPWDGGRAILYFIFIALFSLLLGVLLYGPLGFYGSIVISEIIGFGLIPFILSRFFDTGWEWWTRGANAGGPFWVWAAIGIVSFSIAQSNLPVLIDRVYPIPEGQLVMFEQYLTAGSPLGLVGIILVAAVVPAICEELSFRGLILSGLQRSYGSIAAVIWSGFLFALLHLNPWTFIGLWSLGCFLGYITIRLGSVWPAIILHLINNGFALTFFYVQGKAVWEERPEFIPWYVTVVAGITLLLSIWQIHKITGAIQEHETVEA